MLKIITGVLLALWLVLVLIGKGGFVHTLLLIGVAIAAILLVKEYRRRLTL